MLTWPTSQSSPMTLRTAMCAVHETWAVFLSAPNSTCGKSGSTHAGLNEMSDIWKTTFLKAFSKKKSFMVQISLKFVLTDPIDNNSALVQLMAWCCQAPSHYPNQCWPSSMTHICDIRAQCVAWDAQGKKMKTQNFGKRLSPPKGLLGLRKHSLEGVLIEVAEWQHLA